MTQALVCDRPAFVQLLIDNNINVENISKLDLYSHIKFLIRDQTQISYERDLIKDKDIMIDLFIWSILFNRVEIAKIILTIANVFIIINTRK